MAMPFTARDQFRKQHRLFVTYAESETETIVIENGKRLPVMVPVIRNAIGEPVEWLERGRYRLNDLILVADGVPMP